MQSKIHSIVCILVAVIIFSFAGCGWEEDPGGDLEPGSWGLTIDYDGDEREFGVYIPKSYDGSKAVPLVVIFHGYMDTALNQADTDGFTDKADSEGFIVAYPVGIGSAGLKGWNAGTACCGTAENKKVDDVGFAKAVVETLSERCNIDLTRVYAHGHSNGAGLAHRLGREASDVFAAISPKSMPVLVPDSIPDRAVPVIQFHGSSDGTIDIDGGKIAFEDDEYISEQESFENWANVNGCTGDPEITTYGDSTCMTYTDCDSGTEVTYCTLDGGGHNNLYSHDDIDVTDMAWDFMSKFSK